MQNLVINMPLDIASGSCVLHIKVKNVREYRRDNPEKLTT